MELLDLKGKQSLWPMNTKNSWMPFNLLQLIQVIMSDDFKQSEKDSSPEFHRRHSNSDDIHQLKKRLAQMELEMTNLHKELDARFAEVAKLTAILLKKEEETVALKASINEMNKSIVWKIARRLYKIQKIIRPQKS